MAQDSSRRFNWAGLPVIATVARLLCRELTLENEYLRVGEVEGEEFLGGVLKSYHHAAA